MLSTLLPGLVSAATVTVNVGELTEALHDARRQPDAVTRLVLDEIQAKLNDADVALADGELIYRDVVTDQLVEDGCNNTTLLRVATDIRLTAETGLGFAFESLFDPLQISLNLAAELSAVGRARQNFGFRLGNCVEVASDTFDFTADGPLRLELVLLINLNPVWADAQTLRVAPEVTIAGELREGNITVDVDDSLIRGLIEEFLQSEVDELLGPYSIQSGIDSLQQRIDEQLREALDDSGNGTFDIELPAPDDAQIAALYELLTPQARFPLTASFIEAQRLPLIAALITDDQSAIDDILSSAVECQLGGVLQTELERTPLYSNASGSCELLTDVTTAGTYFSTADCSQPLSYTPTDMASFCATALDANRLGNALSNTDELDRWTLSPGNTFEFGVVSLAGKQQPFSQRLEYKRFATAAGECALEMRIYAGSPVATGQRALIALHGGSWQRRGSGFLGIEHMATHFVDAGFVVFAPFYRLIGDADGVAACHNAELNDLITDTNDAFDWVLANQQRFGASGNPVVFGQSAGGHLALSLAVRRPAEVQAAALFYAPTDFADFASEFQRGAYDNPQGQRIIEAVTGVPLDAIDSNTALIRDNSFPTAIQNNPGQYPPMFMLHGESDSLLPARQSVRLCNGLSGNAEQGPASGDRAVTVNRRVRCDDRGSELHLIGEGEHTLDLCISPELCLAGSPASAAATEDAVQRMLKWVQNPAAVDSETAKTGAGGVGWEWLILLFACFRSFVKKSIQYVSK